MRAAISDKRALQHGPIVVLRQHVLSNEQRREVIAKHTKNGVVAGGDAAETDGGTDVVGTAEVVVHRIDFVPGQFAMVYLEAKDGWRDPAWWSGDLHVHMNYGGLYRNTPAQLAEQDPLINVRQDDHRHEIAVSLYGEVQKEVVGATLANDFGIDVTFVDGTDRAATRRMTVVLPIPGTPVSSRTHPATIQLFFDVLA